MSSPIPEPLKKADISRFVTRAAQIEKAKPAIAYWCYYWIVQQIVVRGLHNASEESLVYTTNLMDKLEVAKATDDDAIKDEIAAKALVEQFGLEVFSRADNAVLADKVTKQTADTFQAAYTFLELLQIWPPLDAEIAAKIKYAKYHALRVVKAIKNGEDPNLSNPPKLEPETTSIQDTGLDPNDPEVRALQGTEPDRRASVGDVPGEADGNYTQSAADLAKVHSIHPSQDIATTEPSTTDAEHYYSTSKDVSPIGPPSIIAPPSIGGGYFPRASDLPSSPGSPPLVIPSAPVDIPDSPFDMSPIQPPAAPSDLPGTPYNGFTPASVVPPSHNHIAASSTPTNYGQPSIPADIDDVAIAQAQKHARWAISALNFEDTPTAIKEFREALELLGARGGW